MKSKYLQIATVFVAAVLACTIGLRSGAAETDAKAGQVAVQSDVVDVGQIVRGSDATGTFVLENVGAETLRILRVKPACGCTIASFDEEIAPGQKGKVTATVKTEKFHGPIEKALTVTTSDPQNPKVVLKIKANVVEAPGVATR